MSSITTLRDDKTGRQIKYRARYRTPDGASRTRTFDKKADAEAFLTSVEHRKLSGEYVDVSEGRVTFGSYARQWAASQPHRATTAEGVELILRHHILPTFESRHWRVSARAMFRRGSQRWAWLDMMLMAW